MTNVFAFCIADMISMLESERKDVVTNTNRDPMHKEIAVGMRILCCSFGLLQNKAQYVPGVSPGPTVFTIFISDLGTAPTVHTLSKSL